MRNTTDSVVGILGLQAGEDVKELRAEENLKAEASWRSRKALLAVYWRAVAVYAGHIARLLRDEAKAAV